MGPPTLETTPSIVTFPDLRMLVIYRVPEKGSPEDALTVKLQLTLAGISLGVAITAHSKLSGL